MTSILGRMATYSGQVIDWEKAINSGIDIMPKKFGWNEMPLVLPGDDGFYPIPVPGKVKYF